MNAYIAEPSRTLNIFLDEQQLANLTATGHLSLDVHRDEINGYIQFIHITKGENDMQCIGRNDYMRVEDLKKILNGLPDEMLVVIPVVDEDDVNRIYGFRKVGTAGILEDESEAEGERKVLCLNGSANGQDLADQIYFSGKDVSINDVLYGRLRCKKLEVANES